MKFAKDEHIVILKDTTSKAFLKDHCYKQRESHWYLKSYLDSHESDRNGIHTVHIENKHNWRYATEIEALQYEMHGKPFNTQPEGFIWGYYANNMSKTEFNSIETTFSYVQEDGYDNYLFIVPTQGSSFLWANSFKEMLGYNQYENVKWLQVSPEKLRFFNTNIQKQIITGYYITNLTEDAFNSIGTLFEYSGREDNLYIRCEGNHTSNIFCQRSYDAMPVEYRKKTIHWIPIDFVNFFKGIMDSKNAKVTEKQINSEVLFNSEDNTILSTNSTIEKLSNSYIKIKIPVKFKRIITIKRKLIAGSLLK